MDNEQTKRARRKLVEGLTERGYLYSTTVTRALETVPRHEFVPESVRDRAYADEPLAIGRDQVVTAPHLVAQMTELLELSPGQPVLEIGTGSGYHAAVIAEIVGGQNVFTSERFPDLATSARVELRRTGYGDVTVTIGDGTIAMPCHPPFDRISVTAVAPAVPDPLCDQLAEGGRMVIPLGPRDGAHELEFVTKRDGRQERANHGGVRFVPLVGAQGFPDGS